MPKNPTKPNHIYLIYMYKEDLALNNLQWLICHKAQPNQIIYIWYICIKRIWHWITYNGWYAIKPKLTKSYIYIYIYMIYMYKEDLALNNLQGLICYKTKPTSCKVKLASVVAVTSTPKCRGGATPFFGLLPFTLDTYLILLSVMEGGIKFHF